ncbi:MAG: hypothetical protein KDC43_17530 [Saprospiraceae bacterium]|nr:hypothetical protein [Saprospiraceae bacterium]MCB0625662.1 hypothetical protein [Saprospiraceae bacterium]MCB0684256.1 hypothetical protein [Saprospiraceae bacterium]
MKLSVLDRALYKDNFIGRRYVKSTAQKRNQLLKFRQMFNRDSLQARMRLAQEIGAEAAVKIEDDLGFHLVQGQPFPEVPSMVEQALEIVRQNDVEALRENKKDQLLTRILKKDQLSLESPFVQFALRKDVVAAVSNYLGMVPVLAKVDIWYSKESEELGNSQLHHCDFESERQVKLFIYCTEVTQESGPLVVIDAKRSDLVRDKIGYRYGQKIPDSIIDPIVPPEQQFTAICPKGTMVFADTSRCFHYGSRVQDPDHHRVAILYQFLRPQSFAMPLNFINNSPFSFLAREDMPQYQRQLLGVE